MFLWEDFVNTERNVKIYLVIKPLPLVLVKYHMTTGLEKPQAAWFHEMWCDVSASTLNSVALVVKDPPASAGDIRDTDSIPGSGRSPGGGNGNPLQYTCLKGPMDRGAWQATYSPWGSQELDTTEVTCGALGVSKLNSFSYCPDPLLPQLPSFRLMVIWSF